MNDLWFISDTHFNHANMLGFKRTNGELLRPGFSSIEEHDEHIIENWNSRIKPTDKVYHLGDVGFGREQDIGNILRRLHGHKRLIVGNHDRFPASFYAEWFEKVGSEFRRNNRPEIIFTHRPIHINPDPFEKVRWNVHGHTHEHSVRDKHGKRDTRYLNISCEEVGYRPLHWDEIREMLGNE